MHFSSDDRHILVLTGAHDKSLQYAKDISLKLNSILILDPKSAKSLLGQEFDAVIFDMHKQFDPNAFGAISGTIRGGGFLILLRPVNSGENSLFLTRFNQILTNTSQVTFVDIKKDPILLPQPSKRKHSQAYATKDQETAVAAIIKVAKGHRRRPLIISSDRGRGKSAALGIASAELIGKGINNIIICAFSKKTVATVFKYAELSLIDGKDKNLTFYSPDELNKQKPKADLVLIDEAAAIPLPILTSLLKNYSRIVFSSTQHGYEGHGRGFSINFHKVLDKETSKWKNVELKTPIRWNKNDSLEKFTYEALLLDADLAKSPFIKDITIKECIFKKINKVELIKKNKRLKQLFGLLVNAHYQTKPSDLLQLLDDESVSIYCLETNDLIVAVSLIISEGNINHKLLSDIFAGRRRLKGHLIAQSLSSNVGIKNAPTLSGERISRIAVHPLLQGQGFGSSLINNLVHNSTADYLSTCFGATPPLINFWKKMNFSEVHLGLKREASSGEHSLTMLYPKSENGKVLTKQAKTIFSNNLPHLLSDSLNSIESEIIYPLLPRYTGINIHKEEESVIQAFANEYRGYENCLHLIWNLTWKKLRDSSLLTDREKRVLIIKVLQKRSWEELIDLEANILGKKQALVILRQAIKKLV